MGYVTDEKTLGELARALLAKMDEQVAIDKAPNTEPEMSDWRDLRAELERYAAAPSASTPPASVGRLVQVYADGEGLRGVWREFHGDRRATRETEVRKKELEALEAVTYEVQLWRGDHFAKPQRVARTTVDEWLAKPGHTVKSEPYSVQAKGSFDVSPGDGHPTGGYGSKSLVIGAELPEGTVKSKRLVIRDGKKVVEYLVKARGKAAEIKYQRAQRLKELREKLDAGLDYLTQEQIAATHAEITQLESQQ